MFDRFDKLPAEIISHTLSFFSPKQLGCIAPTSKIFNASWQQYTSDLKKQACISNSAFSELEKRCHIYTYQDTYCMVIDSADLTDAYFQKNVTDKTILAHPFIQDLKGCGTFGLYFYSPNGKEFYCMDSSGYGGSTDTYFVSFYTHESNRDQERCELYVDSTQACLLRPKTKHFYGKKPEEENILATYHLVHPKEKNIILMELLAKKSQLIPLQYREEPLYLFKCSDLDQHIFITQAGKGYDFKVLIGNADNWQEILVEGVKRYRDGGTICIALEEASGYKTIFSPSPPGTNLKPKLTLPDGREFELEKLNHLEYDYASIGITLGLPKTRPTLLDKYQNDNQSLDRSFAKTI